MTHTYHDLQHKCRTLRLAETAKTLPNMLRQAESKNWTYYEWLDQIFSYELECREEKNRAKLMKWAEFPQHLTLDQFKLAEQSAIGDKQLNVLKELSWIEVHFTLIMMVPRSVGIPPVSTGLSIHAVNQGYQVSLIPMDHLVYILKTRDYITMSSTRYKRMEASDLTITDD